MAIEGALQELALTEIIQLNCHSGEEVWVSLRQGDREGGVYFANGQIVHAFDGDATGEEAVYQLLSWPDGFFRIEKGVKSPQQTVAAPWDALLMEGLRRLDESAWDETKSVLEDDAGNQPPESDFILPAQDIVLEGEQQMSKAQEILQQLADDLDDFVNASVVGKDGMAIANLSNERGFDEQKAAASLAQLVKQATESAAFINAGAFVENIVTAEKYMMITRPIGSGNFFLELVIKAGGNLGAARMYMEEYESDLLEALPRSAR